MADKDHSLSVTHWTVDTYCFGAIASRGSCLFLCIPTVISASTDVRSLATGSLHITALSGERQRLGCAVKEGEEERLRMERSTILHVAAVTILKLDRWRFWWRSRLVRGAECVLYVQFSSTRRIENKYGQAKGLRRIVGNHPHSLQSTMVLPASDLPVVCSVTESGSFQANR